jgi:predicted TIM-barrel fold metal-dependent hydrolase
LGRIVARDPQRFYGFAFVDPVRDQGRVGAMIARAVTELGFADDWRAQLALIDHLVRHPNIYTDTAGVRRFDLLQQARTGESTQRTVWLGWPLVTPRR